MSQDALEEGDGGKRPTASVGTSPERKRLKVQPLPEGVIRIQNEGLGNCLFIAVSQSIEATSKQQHSHRSIRAAAVKHLRKHRDQYFMWWDNLWPDGTKCVKETIDGFDEYIGKLAQIGSWAGSLELAALATTMDRPVFVLHEVGQVYGFCPPGSNRDIFFSTASRKAITKLFLLLLRQLFGSVLRRNREKLRVVEVFTEVAERQTQLVDVRQSLCLSGGALPPLLSPVLSNPLLRAATGANRLA